MAQSSHFQISCDIFASYKKVIWMQTDDAMTCGVMLSTDWKQIAWCNHKNLCSTNYWEYSFSCSGTPFISKCRWL